MTERFKELIKRRTHEQFVVEVDPHEGSVVASAQSGSEADSLLGEQLERPRSHAWIETMTKFRTELSKIHREGVVGEPKRVKVGSMSVCLITRGKY
jgi:DNA-binding IclR family transcriptional regulator